MKTSQKIFHIFILISLLAASCTLQPANSRLAKSDRPLLKDPSASPEDLKALAEGNVAFGFDLYRTLAGKDGNLFFSPYSISLALAMTRSGATGNTANQMDSTLHFTLPQARLNPAFNAYSQELAKRARQTNDDTPFELNIANSLWGEQSLTFLQPFLDLLAENYGAGMHLVDFINNSEASRQAINQWVSDETHGKIKDLIPAGALDALTRLVLANAIYFKADWLHTFEKKSTQAAPFHLLDGSTRDAQMMNQTERFSYAIMKNYKAIDLPYSNGGISMRIILPDEGQFKAVEGEFNSGLVEDIGANLTDGEVILSLPKFTYESTFNLNDTLKSLGMVDAFATDLADFSGMDGKRDLYIGKVLHKAFVAVDEKGTEAAAATVVIMGLTSAMPGKPIRFNVDRPFLFLIRDDQSGNILFAGRVLDPEK